MEQFSDCHSNKNTDNYYVLFIRENLHVTICLPESFEWVILKSGLIPENELTKILENPSDYIDSEKYFSWEQFFEKYLVEHTKDTHMKYTKKSLGKFYRIENNAKRIAAVIMLG